MKSHNLLTAPYMIPAIVTIASIPVLTQPVWASTLSLVQDRDLLQSNDQIEWLSLGKVLNPFDPNPDDFLPNSFSISSANGLGVNVEIPPIGGGGDITPPFVFQNTTDTSTNFALNDYLLFTGFSPTVVPTGNPNPLTLVFDESVQAAGTQIAASGSEFIDYEVFISAFDDANDLLSTFSLPGISSGARDDSAVFLGVRSDTANIKRLVLSTSSPQRGFGINTVSIATQVPEPSTILGFSTFLVLGVISKGNKRRVSGFE